MTGMAALAVLAAVPATGHEHPGKVRQVAAAPANGNAVTVVATEFKFTPNAIRVREGQAVTIEFKNEGRMSHNLTIPKLGQHTATIQSGTEATLHFTASKTGTFPFWCTVPGHKQAGMVGKVVVGDGGK